ncbi:MAG: hypothetical protein MUD08_14680 [Cytophagales bacterium]|jgi:hypothetical protein|nr:hypothetical protein [Cytophagales bacterium]
MSEPSSLFAKIKIKPNGLKKFLSAPPAPFADLPGWDAWWDSREMYDKSTLRREDLEPYGSKTNRAALKAWQKDPENGVSLDYDEASQTWYVSILMFSENYFVMLAMLGLLRSIGPYKEPDDTDFILVHPYLWYDSNGESNAYICFKGNESFFMDKVKKRDLKLASAYWKKKVRKLLPDFDD